MNQSNYFTNSYFSNLIEEWSDHMRLSKEEEKKIHNHIFNHRSTEQLEWIPYLFTNRELFLRINKIGKVIS